MAANLPSTSSAQTDTVAIFDQNFNQVFPLARPIKVVVKEEAKSMESPLENGSMIIDHRVILPVELELSMITQSDDAEDVYREIRQYYLNGTLLSVHTLAGVYENNYITGIPHEESSDNIDVLIIALKLKQAQLVNSQNSTIPNNNVKNPANTDNVDRGTLQPKSVTPRSTVSQLFYGS
jgi:hypothetical protein